MSVVLFVVVIAVAVWLARLAARTPRAGDGRHALWRLACLIGAVRISLLWLGTAASRDPGWPQGFGYVFQLVGLPEIYFARSTRADPLTWLIVGSTLLAVSSFGWAAVLLWIGNRTGSRGTPTAPPNARLRH